METLSRADAQAYAQRAEALIRQRGNYEHISVRAYGSYLVVQADGVWSREPIARLSYLGSEQFSLTLLKPSGGWETMPLNGVLEAVTADLIETVAPYVERLCSTTEASA